MDSPFLLSTVFNELRFSKSPLLGTSVIATRLTQNYLSGFDLSRVGGLQGGQPSGLRLTQGQAVMKEINSGKDN